MNLYAIDPGFDPKGVAVVDIVASANLPSAERNAKLQELTTALKELPGVQTAAFGMKLPLRGNGNNFGIQVEGVESQERLSTFFRIGSQEYLQALGVRLRSGRFFDVSDQPDSTQLSVIINESLARKFFPNQDPIGRRVLGGFGVPQRIVGVVADAAEGDLLDEPKPARYYLATQAWFGNSASLVIKTKRPEDATVILDAARSTINRVAPEFAIQETTTMSRVFDKAVGPARQIMALLTLLSALALTLGAVGIYGVISHFAARRKRDWAIRVALGLPGHRVVSHMLGQGALLVLLGVTIGGFGTVALAKTLDAFLYGVGRVDPVAFALASAALLLTGVAAAYVPARRAGRVDPALVLRED
jgi:ABC-type antimicrobial peptide transport system permease subunit